MCFRSERAHTHARETLISFLFLSHFSLIFYLAHHTTTTTLLQFLKVNKKKFGLTQNKFLQLDLWEAWLTTSFCPARYNWKKAPRQNQLSFMGQVHPCPEWLCLFSLNSRAVLLGTGHGKHEPGSAVLNVAFYHLSCAKRRRSKGNRNICR